MNDTNLFSLMASPSVLPSFFGPELPYSGPTELLAASELSIGEKRELLSSWASDARAVPDAPALRMLDNGRAVTIHDILEALKTLDDLELDVKSLPNPTPISRSIATPLARAELAFDRVVFGKDGAVGKWPAGATVESLA